MSAKVLEFRPRRTSVPRKTYVRLEETARQRVFDELDVAAGAGPLSEAVYAGLARALGVSRSTVYRLARAWREECGHGRTSRALVLPHDALVTTSQSGSMRASWQLACTSGAFTGSYRSWIRGLYRHHGANVVRGVTDGTANMPFTPVETLTRDPFMHVYTTDFMYLRAPTIDADGNVVRPVLMFVREDHTGVLVNWHVFPTDEITFGQVRSVIGLAMRGRWHDHDGGRMLIGGVPDMVRCDNGSTFVARDLEDDLSKFGVRIGAINSYSSRENGAHERLHETLRCWCLACLSLRTGRKTLATG